MRILFDATRLAQRRGSGMPTGIDRVVLAYGRWLAGREDIELAPVASSFGRLTPLTRRLFDRLRGDEALRAAPVWPTGWAAKRLSVSARYLASRLAPRQSGDLYLNVGHSGLDRPDFLGGLAAAGLPIAVMIHDLIPITHPEFCAPAAGPRHLRRLEAVLAHARLIITNSRATADDVLAFARARGSPAPNVRPAPLGVEETFLCGPSEAAAEPDRPYFVVVGTIEARKNLAFLLTLWRRLEERLGPRTPRLFIVGRRGWENEAVLDHLERSESAHRLVKEAPDVDDRALARLLSGARALLAPSLVEGFDLPVVEAMALGIGVIASDIPVHRELAAGATLIDPLDGPGWIAAIEAALLEPGERRVRPVPTWAEHFAIVGKALGLT